MKRRIFYLLAIPSVLVVLFSFSSLQKDTSKGNGWLLAYQSYTFKNFSFEEGLQKASGLGLKYVEAYSGQRLSLADSNLTHYTSTKETRKEMKRLLKKYRVE